MSIDAFPPSLATTTTDDTLDALAGLSTSANTMPYFTGVDAAALTPLTPFIRTLLDDPDLATAQATLGITGGGGGSYTDEEAQDAIGAMLVDTATIDLTYTDATPSLTASVIAGSIGTTQLTNDAVTYAKIQNVTDNRLLGRNAGSTGDVQELSIGTGLSLTGGVLSTTLTQYTDEQAQDAVGAMLTDTATIDLTYGDGGPTLQADVKDVSITEAKLTFVDVTTRDASTSTHGLLRKLSGVATQYLDGSGAWTVPPAGTTYTDEQAQDAVGTIIVDSSRINFTYTDATPSITADLIAGSITEVYLGLTNTTSQNATTGRHGFLLKLSGNATDYMDGTGAWTTPEGWGSPFLLMGA